MPTWGGRIRMATPRHDAQMYRRYKTVDVYYMALQLMKIGIEDIPEMLPPNEYHPDGFKCREYIDMRIAQDYITQTKRMMDPELKKGVETSSYINYTKDGMGIYRGMARDRLVAYYDGVLEAALALLIQNGVFDTLEITPDNREYLIDLYCFMLQSGQRTSAQVPDEIRKEAIDRIRHPEKGTYFTDRRS